MVTYYETGLQNNDWDIMQSVRLVGGILRTVHAVHIIVQEHTEAGWYCLVPLIMTLVLHLSAFI